MGVFQQLVQERRVFIVADEAAQKDVTIEIGQVRATLAAPPRTDVMWSTLLTGTGASGEMRSTLPNT